MKFQIKRRVTGAVLFEGEFNTLKDCAAAAVKARADLSGADLAGANLARADLVGANLSGADLSGADLADAYLVGANLARADLAYAYLVGADLDGTKNVPDGKTQNDPPEPYDRKFAAERCAERAARYRADHPEVPVVEALDVKILNVIESGAGKLRMDQWHTCETTHCRAGWAITLAGEAGADLEAKHGSHRAGMMIYRASTGRVPHFFANDSRALEDIREQAALQVTP